MRRLALHLPLRALVAVAIAAGSIWGCAADRPAIQTVDPSALRFAFGNGEVGGDADSIGAGCGQFAGAKYGLDAIPERWLAAIKDGDKIADLFDRFLAALDNAPALS